MFNNKKLQKIKKNPENEKTILKKCIYILKCMHMTGEVVFRITNGSAFFLYLTHQHHEKAKRNKWFCIDFYVLALGE